MVWAIQITIFLPNNIILLITIVNFDPNPILININKKPYKFIADKKLQLVLAKPNDQIIDELVETIFFEPLLVENKIFELVDFELIINNLIDGNISINDIHVHYHSYVFFILTTYLFAIIKMTYLLHNIQVYVL